jgi:hypothetical protein
MNPPPEATYDDVDKFKCSLIPLLRALPLPPTSLLRFPRLSPTPLDMSQSLPDASLRFPRAFLPPQRLPQHLSTFPRRLPASPTPHPGPQLLQFPHTARACQLCAASRLFPLLRYTHSWEP